MSEVADSERPLFPSDSLTRDIEEVEASGEVDVPGLAAEEGKVSVSFWEELVVPGSTFSLPLATKVGWATMEQSIALWPVLLGYSVTLVE